MTFQEFRHQISVMEMAMAIGFRQDKSKGSKWPVMVSGLTGEKIIIVNPGSSSNQGYFNPNDDKDKGTLIDFVRYRLGSDFPKDDGCSLLKNVSEVLSNHLRLPREPTIIAQPASIQPYEYSPADCKPLVNKDYIRSRGISEATLQASEFVNTVFNKHLNGFHNTSFPYKDGNGTIKGVEFRNHNYKRFSPGMDRSNSIWHSNLPEKLDQIALAESPIDALSYHQLKQPINTWYVAFGGSVAERQVLTLKEMVSSHNNQSSNIYYLSIVDNDPQGMKYDAKFERLLSPSPLKLDKPIAKDFNEDLMIYNRFGMFKSMGPKL